MRPRGSAWQAEFGTVGGKRDQRSYKSREEAKQAIDLHLLRNAELGRVQAIEQKDKFIGWHNLSERDKFDGVTALELLDGKVSLADAARHYQKTVPDADNQKTAQEVFDLYLASKEATGKRPQTLKDYQKAGRFASDFADKPMHEITVDDLEAWLNRKKYTGTTRDNYRRHLRMIFKFALQRGYVHENVAQAIAGVSTDESLPRILTVKEVRLLMANVSRVAPHLEPYFAIGLFAGLRPNELEYLDREQIALDKQRITVTPETAKKRRQRYVDISDNLTEWLLPHRSEPQGRQPDCLAFARGRSSVTNQVKSVD
jgi:integrase